MSALESIALVGVVVLIAISISAFGFASMAFSRK